MWAILALGGGGSHGIASSHVCVDLTCTPSGRFIVSSLLAGWMFSTGVPGRTKCPMAPALAIAWSTTIFILDVLSTISKFSFKAILENSNCCKAFIIRLVSLCQYGHKIFQKGGAYIGLQERDYL